MPGTVGIFHGYGGYKDNSWLVNLHKKLKDLGVNSICPSFPFLGSSTIEEWFAEFEKYISEIVEPMTFVGHSGGTIFSFYVVSKLNLQFDKLILVCPLKDTDGAEISGILEKPGREEQAPFVKNFVDQHFDFDLIKAKVKEFVFILSDDDPNVPYEETKKYYQTIFPTSKFITLHNYGHVNEKSGVTDLPIVFEDLVKLETL